VLVLLLASVAVGCGGGGAESDGGSVTVWSWRTEDVAGYQKIFAEFEKETGIKAEFKPYKNTEYDTILETALKGGKGPDVMQLRAYGGLQPLVDGGYLAPVGDKVDLEGFSEESLDGARGIESGKIYGVPFAIQTLQVFYNEKIFSENGIEEPKTYDEFVDAAKKLKGAGVTPLAVGGKDSWTLPILHSVVGADIYGGNQFVDAALESTDAFTEPRFVDSVAAVEDLMPYYPDDPAGVAYTDTQVLFTQEEAAMFIGGSWEAGYFESTNPELKFGTFPMPPREGSGLGLVSGFVDGSYGVNAKSDNKEAAFELAEFMASKKFGQMFADELKQISPVPGVEFEDPVLKGMVDDYEANSTPYMLLVYFRYGDPSGTDLIGADIQKMMLGKEDAKQVAANLKKGVSQWYEPGMLDSVGGG
jgi:raffinose/stachyose/melibiose transport system substrate-binding protein